MTNPTPTADLKQRPEFQEDEPIWKGKWKNLDFARNGKSYRNKPIFNSEIEAKITSDEAYIWVANSPLSLGLWETMDGVLSLENYSHTIQIPWHDKG